MHLVDVLALRATPAAGISIGITRRCPLHCDHCSTSSTPHSEQSPARIFTRFVHTFTKSSHPVFMAMSGGEALLRPNLVRSLALRARESGTRSSVLSGMFFAKHGSIPPRIKAAIDAVDHFSASIDVFHEREVARLQVFKVLGRLLDEGKALSLHIAGEHAEDPYLDHITQDVKKHFGRRIPMLVNTLSPFGRGQTLIRFKNAGDLAVAPQNINPCTMAAWPVVGFDGIVAACGNDSLIGQVPEHLRLGDIRHDDWSTIAARCQNNSILKTLRIYGPIQLGRKLAKPACGGYCNTCIDLNTKTDLQKHVQSSFSAESLNRLELVVSNLQRELGAQSFANRYSHPKYSDLVFLGA